MNEYRIRKDTLKNGEFRYTLEQRWEDWPLSGDWRDHHALEYYNMETYELAQTALQVERTKELEAAGRRVVKVDYLDS